MREVNETKKPPQVAVKKERSPNYPGIGPSEALRFAEMIWKRDKRNPLSSDMACQHMGYKAKNGTSLPILAALKRYGLLISAGTDVRISEDAHTIFLAPSGHTERDALIKKMAMRPALFTEVLKRFADGLPSDANLRFRLRQEWNFATDKAADNFIRSLKDAVSLAGVASWDELADSGSEDSSKDRAYMPQEQAISSTQAQQPPRSALIGQPPGSQVRSWDLGGGSIMSVAVPGALSKGNIEKLKKYVSALEMEASIAWDESEPK